MKVSAYICLFIALLIFSSFSPDEKYVRKAICLVEKGQLKEARTWYERAIEKNPDNYRANLGMGLLLSELLGNYAGGQPYLEKAFNITSKDTVPALMYALAKCYQHNAEYAKAIAFFEKLTDYRDAEEETDLEEDIKKRIADCRFGLQHSHDAPSANWYIVNAGKMINTEMPEYVPVLTPENELIFTSRRKDHEKEELSYLDGKYFESMYISRIDAAGFQAPRRYTLPDHLARSHFMKRHESVVSMSPDGKKLFTFRNNKIFEIGMEERKTQKPKKLLKTINFDFYQNHAFLTKDGNTLYFTSEAKGGLGGIDIYKATKIKEGEWSEPENLGAPVNSRFDEDAPFVTDDGKTLYFASNGHEGFGNFDIFKSELVDGKWSAPVNLGRPVNSAGHDIFLIMDPSGATGYFSSSRVGGFGDMDIYRINDLDKMDKSCPPVPPAFVNLRINDANPDDFASVVELNIPPDYKILSHEWLVNGVPVQGAPLMLNYDYKTAGTHTVSAKIIAYCDTCLSPLVACVKILNELAPAGGTDTLLVKDRPISEPDLTKQKGLLSEAQLRELGFNTGAILFDFAKSRLRADMEHILRDNIKVLRQHPELKAEIIGYADSRGSDLLNTTLSAKRAATVKRYLLKHGIPASQFKSIAGKGSTELVNDCGGGKDCDEAAHQQNRRVVFRVYSE